MNNIEAIDRLVSTSIKVKVPRNPTKHQVEVELEIKKLPLDKIELMNFSAGDKDLPVPELINRMKPLSIECLGITEEQLNKISLDYLVEIMEVIMEINMPNKENDKHDLIAKFKEARTPQK